MAAECFFCSNKNTKSISIPSKGLIPLCSKHNKDFKRFKKDPAGYLRRKKP